MVGRSVEVCRQKEEEEEDDDVDLQWDSDTGGHAHCYAFIGPGHSQPSGHPQQWQNTGRDAHLDVLLDVNVSSNQSPVP